MHIKRMHEMIEKVTECANSELSKGASCVDTEEMKNVACIIKDLSEAEYYSKISKAMEEHETDNRNRRNYEPYVYNENRDMDRNRNRMYYTENGSRNRDVREGRSGMSRKSYMEKKEMHKGNTQADKEVKMRELENYMRELSDDITEMITDMTQEEKTMMRNKISTLVQKIV